HGTILILGPFRTAGPPLCRAAEGRRDASYGGAGLSAVRRCHVDGSVAALALARVHPAGVPQPGYLRRAYAGSPKEKEYGAENRRGRAGPHPLETLRG